MDESYTIKYDESKEIETIFDFHNCQIFRVNTMNTNLFLKTGNEFDAECQNKVDDQGRVRLIYVVDKIPPLSSILKFVSNPFDRIKWGIYAVVVPPDMPTLSKIIPIIQYGLGITKLKGKFTLKLFEYRDRNNLKEVIEWADQQMNVRESKIDVRTEQR